MGLSVWAKSPRLNTSLDFVRIRAQIKAQKKKQAEVLSVKNPILADECFCGQEPSLYVLVPPFATKDSTGQYPNATMPQLLATIKDAVCDAHPGASFRVLAVSDKVAATKSVLMKEGFDFSSGSKLQSQKHCISPGVPIVTIGDALYAVTRTDELEVERFMDLQFNDAWFYSPRYKSWIFPAASVHKVCADCYERVHFRLQVKKALMHDVPFFPKQELRKIRISIEDFAALPEVRDAGMIAIDTETTGVDFVNDRVLCITAAVSADAGYYIDTSDWLEKDDRWRLFASIVSRKKQVYANGKFDIKFFRKHGVPKKDVHVDWDVVSCDHVLNELAIHNGLKTLTWLYTPYGGYSEEFKLAFKSLGNVAVLPKDITIDYAITDAIVTFQVQKAQDAVMTRIDKEYPNHIPGGWSLRKFFDGIMMPATNLFADVEYQGMLIDVQKIDCAQQELAKKAEALVDRIKSELQVTDPTFNIDSGVQLGKLLADRGWPCVHIAKDGYYLTNDFCLQRWASLGYTTAALIMEYRGIKTLLKTYVGAPESDGAEQEYLQYDLDGGIVTQGKHIPASGYYQYLRKHSDGTTRVHPTFWVMLADSMRNKCSDPNLQNIPKRGEAAEMIRSYFTVPSKNWLFGEWDAAGLQLRIAGIISGDGAMRKAFMDPFIKGDLHSVTAQTIFKDDISLEEFFKRLRAGDVEVKACRQKAKSANFSLLFNTTGFAFAHSVLEKEWTLEECKQYISEQGLSKLQANYAKKLLLDKGKVAMFPTRQSKIDFSHYWAVASHIKEKFFKKYTGLKGWIEECQAFAQKNGYIRSVFGPFRRLPQLLYQGRDTPQGSWKNMLNIAVNTSVQTFEAALMMTAMVELGEKLESQGLQSRIVGNVHDSCPMYIYKSELDMVKKLIAECFQKDRPENQGVPLTFDLAFADIFAGEIW